MNPRYYTIQCSANKFGQKMDEALSYGHEPQGAPMLYRQQRGDSPNYDFVNVAQVMRQMLPDVEPDWGDRAFVCWWVDEGWSKIIGGGYARDGQFVDDYSLYYLFKNKKDGHENK